MVFITQAGRMVMLQKVSLQVGVQFQQGDRLQVDKQFQKDIMQVGW